MRAAPGIEVPELYPWSLADWWSVPVGVVAVATAFVFALATGRIPRLLRPIRRPRHHARRAK